MEPLELFDAAVAALNREDWFAVARLCDPASLGGFKRQMLERYAPTLSLHEMTAEEYRQHEPELPIEAAEYFVQQVRLHPTPAAGMAEELPEVSSVEQLRALAADEVFVRWLVGRSPRRQMARVMAEGHAGMSEEKLREVLVMSTTRYEKLGVVADGERVAHVIYRQRIDGGDDDFHAWLAKRPFDEQELARDLHGRGFIMSAPCRRQENGTWLLIADHDFMRLSNFVVSAAAEIEDRPPLSS